MTTPTFPIDIVILWVDGSDPKWLEKKRIVDGNAKAASDDDTARYRELGTFKYAFRSIAENAPWVNHIYLVTDDQVPDFLDTNNEKITIVDHKDIIPPQYLPCFNSAVIETHVNRIEGLSEHYLLCNDDTFLNAPVEPSFFFASDGRPRYFAGTFGHFPNELAAYEYDKFNAMGLVNRNVSPMSTKQFLQHFTGHGIGFKDSVKNVLRFAAERRIDRFYDEHLISPYLKSTLDEIWELEPEFMEAASAHPIRCSSTVNQFVSRYLLMARCDFEPRGRIDASYNLTNCDMELWENDIANATNPMICLNDGAGMTQEHFEEIKERMINALQKRYPEACEYENR